MTPLPHFTDVVRPTATIDDSNKENKGLRSQIPMIVGRYLLLSFSVGTLLGIYNYTIPLLLYYVLLDRLVVFPFYPSPRFDISRRIVIRPRTRFNTRTQDNSK
jgi:hypothetical protein